MVILFSGQQAFLKMVEYMSSRLLTLMFALPQAVLLDIEKTLWRNIKSTMGTVTKPTLYWNLFIKEYAMSGWIFYFKKSWLFMV